jgi:predicted transcriptional regulator
VKISMIKEILDGQYLAGESQRDRVVWSGGAGELLEDILTSAAKDSVLLTGLISVEVIKLCAMAEVGCVVFVRGKRLTREIIDAAERHNLTVLSTPYPLLVACGHLYMQGLRGYDESW